MNTRTFKEALSLKVSPFIATLSLGLLLQSPTYAKDERWDKFTAELLNSHASGQYGVAVASGLEALDYAERMFGPEHVSTATTLTNLALAYEAMGQYDKAIPFRARAFDIFEKLLGPEHESMENRVSNLASLYRAAGQYNIALPLSLRSLKMMESAVGPEHYGTGVRLDSLATLFESMGLYEKALPLAIRALDIFVKVAGPEAATTGTRLNNLAALYRSMGQYEKALPLYLRSLNISETAEGLEHPNTGTVLNNLAVLYRAMGQYEKALSLYLRALRITEKADGADHPSTGRLLNNLAGVYEVMGRYDEALPLMVRSLDISEKAQGPNHANTGMRLNRLGGLHRALGQNEKALPLIVRAVAISEKAEGLEHPTTGTFLNSLAQLYESMGQYDKALALSLRALSISEKAQGLEHPVTGSRLDSLAGIYESMGQHKKAHPLVLRALHISETAEGPDHPTTGTRLNNLADLYIALGHPEKSLPLAQRSYLASVANPMPLRMFDSLKTMAATSRALGNHDAAILYAKQAVNLWQSVRSKNSGGLSAEQNRGLLDVNKRIYSALADWLIAAGRLAEAEQVMAMLKNQELMDLVRRNGAGPTQAELDGKEAQALREMQTLSQEWVKDAQELAALEQKRSSQRSETDTARLKVLGELRVQWNAKMQRWLSGLQASLVTANKDGQTQRDQIGKTSSVMQTLVAATPGDALGLQYILTDKRLSIIFHTKAASAARQVPLSIEEVRKQVSRLRAVLDDPSKDPKPAAQDLYRTLLGPVEAELTQAAPQTLILNLADVLRYVPFAALHDGKQYLAERMAVANHTSAGGASIRPQSGTQWQVGGLGLSEAKGRFSALPSVGSELRAIIKTSSNAAGLIPGQIAMNADFNEDGLRDMLKDQVSVLHIATHFNFQAGSESGSFLLLGDGKELSLATIKNINFTGVQLLTLSACETAKGGGRTDEGEEVEGLAAVVQQKGAQSVMATLWPVADASTAILMREFYRLRTAAASTGNARSLRDAQLALLTGKVQRGSIPSGPMVDRGFATRKESAAKDEPAFATDGARPYAHPYYWAPFVVMGNWL